MVQRVFISYASKDAAGAALQLREKLRVVHEVWMDAAKRSVMDGRD
jgi:hypothetical protein